MKDIDIIRTASGVILKDYNSSKKTEGKQAFRNSIQRYWNSNKLLEQKYTFTQFFSAVSKQCHKNQPAVRTKTKLRIKKEKVKNTIKEVLPSISWEEIYALFGNGDSNLGEEYYLKYQFE